ncbi:unnamed protein product [Sphagnum tenellum]
MVSLHNSAWLNSNSFEMCNPIALTFFVLIHTRPLIRRAPSRDDAAAAAAALDPILCCCLAIALLLQQSDDVLAVVGLQARQEGLLPDLEVVQSGLLLLAILSFCRRLRIHERRGVVAMHASCCRFGSFTPAASLS